MTSAAPAYDHDWESIWYAGAALDVPYPMHTFKREVELVRL